MKKLDSTPAHTSSTIKKLLSNHNTDKNPIDSQLSLINTQQQIQAQQLLLAISQFQQPTLDHEKNTIQQPAIASNSNNGSNNMSQLSYLNLLQQQIPVLLDPAAFLLSNIGSGKSDSIHNINVVHQPLATNPNSTAKLRVLLDSNNANDLVANHHRISNKRNSAQVLVETQNVVDTDIKRLKID